MFCFVVFVSFDFDGVVEMSREGVGMRTLWYFKWEELWKEESRVLDEGGWEHSLFVARGFMRVLVCYGRKVSWEGRIGFDCLGVLLRKGVLVTYVEYGVCGKHLSRVSLMLILTVFFRERSWDGRIRYCVPVSVG